MFSPPLCFYPAARPPVAPAAAESQETSPISASTAAEPQEASPISASNVKSKFDHLKRMAADQFKRRGYVRARIDASGRVGVFDPRSKIPKGHGPSKSADSKGVLLGKGSYGSVYPQTPKPGRLPQVKKIVNPIIDPAAYRFALLQEFSLIAYMNPGISAGCRLIVASRSCLDYDLGARMTMPRLGDANLLSETLNPVGVDPIVARARVLKWLEIASSVCEDASRLHKIGFMHLDIKPANIVNGRLVDFGAALHYTDAGKCKVPKTSPWYKPVSMLLLAEQKHDFSVDVFSIAITLMEKMGWDSSLFSKLVGESGLSHSMSVDARQFKEKDAVYKMHWERAIAEFFKHLSVTLQRSGMSAPRIAFIVDCLTQMSKYRAEERLPYTMLPTIEKEFKAIAAEYAASPAAPSTTGVHRTASTLSRVRLDPYAPEFIPRGVASRDLRK